MIPPSSFIPVHGEHARMTGNRKAPGQRSDERRRRMETEGRPKRNRPDHDGKHRLAFDRNKRKILASQSICGICGQPVDKRLKYPHPLSPCIDHIIPIDRGGHPSDIDNLQLAHWKCNREKSNKLIFPKIEADPEAQRNGNVISYTNRDLPLSMDWGTYKGTDTDASAAD